MAEVVRRAVDDYLAADEDARREELRLGLGFVACGDSRPIDEAEDDSDFDAW